MSVSGVAAKRPGLYRNIVLGSLFVIYTFNFIDRLIFSVLQEPIRHELGFSDLQIGLLSGLAFAVFYTAVGLPIAWAADRFNRVSIISISLAIWSLFTAASGLAMNFWQMFFARLGVGFGEAGCTPPAHSLMSDYFDSKQRTRAIAIYSLGIPVGSLLGLIAGGWVVQNIGWREAFFIVGLPGLVVAVLAKIIIKEPKRGNFDRQTAAPVPFSTVLKTLRSKPTFWIFSLGASLTSLGGYAVSAWMVPHFIRTFHMGYAEVGLKFGLVGIVPMAVGTYLGGWLSDKMGQRDLKWYALVPMFSSAFMAPMFFVALQMQNPWILMAIWVIPAMCSGIWLAPVFGSIQNLVPPNMRAFSSSINLFIINIVGLGVGPTLTGALSTHFTLPDGSNAGPALQSALSLVVWVYVLAAVMYFFASRSIKKDWYGDGHG
ncbi:MAG: MFS transporter [Robiginitomaculum sp.]|nr:MFS transporter [Robiginitomaculum sp.]MDQ7078427.1 MFS transporter [Robiginitomaculum sp.]